MLYDMLPRDIAILKKLDAEVGHAKFLETEWIELVSSAVGPPGTEC